MTKSDALRRVKRVFARYTRIVPTNQQWLARLTGGKLYELYCLSRVLQELTQNYGYSIQFVGLTIRFKMSPGMIHTGDPHFEVVDGPGQPLFEIYTDIEVETLGKNLASVAGNAASDHSTYHELDIAVVYQGVTGMPRYDQIVLGVEGKSHAKFVKSIVKEALGLRRELSILRPACRSALSAASPAGYQVEIPANPPSEYWLAFADGGGTQYADSPKSFGVQLRHWVP